MEYVDGGSLHDRMANGPMAWEELWPLLRQMLLGLEAAHTVGVVHRDIKPRNVLLTTDDTVKLTDFGLARLQSDGDATRTQAVAGTLAYMSPEQVRSLPTLDHRSDLFSLGLTAYEALVGRLPFDRDGGDFTMMRSIVEDPFPPPTTFSESVPPDVAAALMRALEKDPDQRYASAAEMREALAGVGDDATPTRTRMPPPVVRPPKPGAGGAPDSPGPPPGAAPSGRRLSPAVLGGGVAGLLALLLLGWWLTRPTSLTLVPLDGVSYFLDGEPAAGEVDVSSGTYQVLCVANGASATTEVEVGRGASRRVACTMPDQAVDVSASWEGTAEPASVLVDGTQAVPLPTRLALRTGHHTLRVISTRMDSTVTVDVLPTFDPTPPPPLAVAVRGGTAPPPPTNGQVAQSGPIPQPQPPQVQPQQPQSQPQAQPSNPPPSTGPAPARMGTLDIAMDAGVTLSLDGSGMSSGSREMRPGTYTARCQAGPLSESTRVTVAAGQRASVRCYAPARVVRVSVTSTDAERPWMTVVVDGQPGGQTPTQVTLPVGRHTIIVRRRGYEVVGQDMMTVDVPPRFSPDPLPPVPLAFEVRAVN
jgi:hypothetical protein